MADEIVTTDGDGGTSADDIPPSDGGAGPDTPPPSSSSSDSDDLDLDAIIEERVDAIMQSRVGNGPTFREKAGDAGPDIEQRIREGVAKALEERDTDSAHRAQHDAMEAATAPRPPRKGLAAFIWGANR